MSALPYNETNINDIIIDLNNDSNSENTITNSVNSTIIPQQGIIYLQPKAYAVSCEEFNKLRKTHSEESIYSSPASLQLKSSSKVRRMSESVVASPASVSTLTTPVPSNQNNFRRSSREFKSNDKTTKRSSKRGSSSSGSFNGVAILGQPIILTPENKQLLTKISQGQLTASPKIAIVNNFDPPTPSSNQEEDEDQPLLYYVNKKDKSKKVFEITKEDELDSSSEESEESDSEEDSETLDSEESEEEDSESTVDDLEDEESESESEEEEEEEDDDVDKEIVYPMRDGLKLDSDNNNAITKGKETSGKKKSKKEKNKKEKGEEKTEKDEGERAVLPTIKVSQETVSVKEDEEEEQPLFNIKTKLDTKKANRLSRVSFDDANNTVWNIPSCKSPILSPVLSPVLSSPTSPNFSAAGIVNGESSYYIPPGAPGMPMDNNPLVPNMQGPPVTNPLVHNMQGPPVTNPLVHNMQATPATNPLVHNIQGPQITSPILSNMQASPVNSPIIPNMQGPPLTSPIMSNMQGPPLTSPIMSNMQGPPLTSPVMSNMQGPPVTNPLVPPNMQGPPVTNPIVPPSIQGQVPVAHLTQMDNNNTFRIPPTPSQSPTKPENNLVVNIQGQQIPVTQLNQAISFLPKNKNSATEKVRSFGNSQKLISFNELEMSTIPNSAKTKINHPKLEVATQAKNVTGLPSKSSQVKKARQNLEAAALKRRSWCNLNSDILNQVQIIPRVNHQRNSSYPQPMALPGQVLPGQNPRIVTKPLVTIQKPPTSYQNLPGTGNFVNSNNNGIALPNMGLINVPYGTVINTNVHTTHNSINPHNKKEENNKKDEKSEEKRELSPKELTRQRIEQWAEKSKITACPVKDTTVTEKETNNKGHRSITNSTYNLLKNTSALTTNKKSKSADNIKYLNNMEENNNILAALYNNKGDNKNNRMDYSDSESVSSYSSSSSSTSSSSSASSISDKDVSRKKKSSKDKRKHHHRHNSHGSHSRDRRHSHSRDRRERRRSSHSRDRRHENRESRDNRDNRDRREHRHRHHHRHHDSYHDQSRERRRQYREDRDYGRERDYDYVAADPRKMPKHGMDAALRPHYYGNSSNNHQHHLTPNLYNVGPIEVVNPEMAKRSRRRSFSGMPMTNPNIDPSNPHPNMNAYGVKYSPRQNPKRTNIYQNSRKYM